MKLKRIPQTITAALFVAAASIGFAAEEDKSEVTHLVRADKVTGSKLWDFHGNQIGTIDHVLLQPSGEMAFAVINADKFLEADRKVVVPWTRIFVKRSSEDSGDVIFTLDTTREFLKDAPGFDEDSAGELSDPVKARPLYRYWKVERVESLDRTRLTPTRETIIEEETTIEENPR
ncbi:MAG TPA: PRC-barrel domain-containing protein [Verrucomicrobiales bacterium]|nr:PRC-barrel domain-containing protein [Verrucomicrobiales bacterium]